MTSPQILTPAQAAEMLMCSPRTVEDKLRSGDLPGVKFGESWIIPAQALMERVTQLALSNQPKRPRAIATLATKSAANKRPKLPVV